MPRVCLAAAPLFLLVSALAGCASFEPRPLSPQAAAAAFEARSLAAPELQRFLAAQLHRSVPLPSWDLDGLALAALYYHPDLGVARAQQHVAEAGVQVSRQWPNPRLGIISAYDVDAVSGMSPWILGWALLFPIETAGRRGHREAQAVHERDAARFQVAGMAWQVRSRVRGRLVDLDAALRERSIFERTLDLRENLLHAMERRLAAGEDARPDVDAAQAALADAHLQLDRARGRAAAARVALAAAVGLPPAALDTVDLSFDAIRKPVSAAEIPAPAVRRAALTNRADLLAALARYAASQSALQLEVARQYPDLQIGPGYRWDQGADKWSLGIGLTLPLFNQNQGAIARAEAQRELAAARFVALQARGIARTERSLVEYRAALAALGAAQSLAATQRSRAEAAERRFVSGDVDRGALDRARLQALAADGAGVRASIQAQRALGALEDAVEHPLDGAVEVSAPPDPRRGAPAQEGLRP